MGIGKKTIKNKQNGISSNKELYGSYIKGNNYYKLQEFDQVNQKDFSRTYLAARHMQDAT